VVSTQRLGRRIEFNREWNDIFTMNSSHYFSSKPSSKDVRGRIETVLRGKRYSFITSNGVFSKKRVDLGTRVLVENMIIPKTGKLLDLGCGIGIIGIVAASENPELEVHLSDINSRAVKLTKLNIRRHGLKNCRVYEGNLYAPLGEQVFNTVVSNPPVSSGMRKVVFPLVSNTFERLVGRGTIQLVIQSNKGANMLADFLDEIFGSHRVLTKKSGYRVLISNRN
jgi:16S rRNA (guanine1207-N2)-methyltransferase